MIIILFLFSQNIDGCYKLQTPESKSVLGEQFCIFNDQILICDYEPSVYTVKADKSVFVINVEGASVQIPYLQSDGNLDLLEHGTYIKTDFIDCINWTFFEYSGFQLAIPDSWSLVEKNAYSGISAYGGGEIILVKSEELDVNSFMTNFLNKKFEVEVEFDLNENEDGTYNINIPKIPSISGIFKVIDKENSKFYYLGFYGDRFRQMCMYVFKKNIDGLSSSP